MSQTLVSHIGKLAFERNYRNLKGLCVISGKKLLEDMNKYHVFEDVLLLDRIHKKFFPNPEEPRSKAPITPVPALGLKSSNTPIPIEAALLQRLTCTKDAEGTYALATLKIPIPASSQFSDSESAILAIDSSVYSSSPDTPSQVLTQIGTILRSAVAFNSHSVNFCDKAPDIFSPEAIRASQGALWTLPYRMTSLTAVLAHAERAKLAPVQIVVNQDFVGEKFVSLKAALKGKKGVVLLVTAKPRKEFTCLETRLGGAPFQVAVSDALYDLRKQLVGAM